MVLYLLCMGQARKRVITKSMFKNRLGYVHIPKNVQMHNNKENNFYMCIKEDSVKKERVVYAHERVSEPLFKLYS